MDDRGSVGSDYCYKKLLEEKGRRSGLSGEGSDLAADRLQQGLALRSPGPEGFGGDWREDIVMVQILVLLFLFFLSRNRRRSSGFAG